jgi:acylphosphatase
MKGKRVRAVVSGMVQGVCFRYYTQRRAEEFGVNGWVCNRPDGRVEAVFEGQEDAVDRMVDWFRHGPPAAVVRDCRVTAERFSGEYVDFRVEPY